jgi:hypothetical protein
MLHRSLVWVQVFLLRIISLLSTTSMLCWDGYPPCYVTVNIL